MITDGVNYKADEVKKIGENYYVIGKTCFKISNKWRSIDDPEVAYDVAKKTYGLKSKLTWGIISPTEWGYFTPTDRSVDSEVGYYLEYNDCPLYLSWDGKKYLQSKQFSIVNHVELVYNYDPNVQYIKDILEKYSTANVLITPEARLFSTLLKGYSFGLEYETNNGTVPKDKLGYIGLVPLKDGSLRKSNGQEPFEYTTIPLSGAKGVQSVLDQCLFLSELTSFDQDCSLHIHIGGIRKDRRVILALYQLCHALQNHLYDLVPYAKRDPEYFYGAKLKSGDWRKNYARLLPALPGDTESEMLQNLFSFVSNGCIIDKSYKRGAQHREKNKWNRYNRYSIVNFEHLLLGQNNTVEFRIFDMTTSGTKALFLLSICVAIVRYAEAYSNQILNGRLPNSLEEVIYGLKNDFGTTSGNENKNNWANLIIQFIREIKQSNFRNSCIKNHTESSVGTPELLFSSFLKQSKIAATPIPKNPNAPDVVNTFDYDTVLKTFEGYKKMVLGGIDEGLNPFIAKAPKVPEDVFKKIDYLGEDYFADEAKEIQEEIENEEAHELEPAEI